MALFFVCLAAFLLLTSWLWPILFMYYLLKCIQRIVETKKFDFSGHDVVIATISLICMNLSPIVLLITKFS